MWKSHVTGIGIFLFLSFQSCLGLKMNQEVYHITAEPEISITLSCQADEFPGKCSFKMPNGKEICQAEDDYSFFSVDYGSDDYNDCVELAVDIIGDSCKLEIDSFNA